MSDWEYDDDRKTHPQIEDVYNTATFKLASINFVMYILTSIIGGSVILTGEKAAYLFGLSLKSLSQGWIWTPFTSIFTHGSIAHLGFNLIFLLIFGFRLEERNYSENGIYFIYLSTGIISGILSLILFFSFNSVTLGASGAVFGLLGANAGIEKKNNEPTYRRVFFLSIILFIFSNAPNTNIFSHLIGLISGYFLGQSEYIERYNCTLQDFV